MNVYMELIQIIGTSSYVIFALQNNPQLEFQLDKVIELVQMDLNSWSRHYTWIVQQL